MIAQKVVCRMTKREARAWAKARRAELDMAAVGRGMAQALFSLPQWQSAGAVLAFAAMPDEPDTAEILRRALVDGKRLLLPRVRSKTEMDWVEIPALRLLRPGAFGIQEPPADLHGLHLLMAEDNELNREIAVTLLEERGAAITTAENGREAVELFQNAPQGTFDAVLMDVMMPEMNGLEATRAIRAFEHCPPESGIPIIAMTANVFADDVKACLEAGMNSHVGKPLDMQVLAAEICRQMRRHTALLESADFTKLGN